VPREFTVKAGYDYRFGTIGFRVDMQGEPEPINFYFPLRELLEKMKIDPNDLSALMADEYRWTEPLGQDIDPARIRLLEETDWKGKMVLDIGGYDGFAAEIAHKGGARRAICLDNHQYEHYGWADKKKEGVEYITGDLMDLLVSKGSDITPSGIYIVGDEHNWEEPNQDQDVWLGVSQPDVLINYNVLYHVKNPWAFLEKCREIIKPDGEMLLCTLCRYHKGAWVYLYEPRECNNSDESVIWGPSLEALERLLRYTGWEAERYALSHDRVLYRCKPTLEPQSRQSRY